MGPGPDLFSDILRGVSRSFYLSLAVLPGPLRRPIGLAYLFARAADTIADTALIPRERRLEHLEALRAELRAPDPARLDGLRAAVIGPQRLPEERLLLERLPECFGLYRALPPGDRTRLQVVLLTITRGMILDLTIFPGEDEGRVEALGTRADLDRYTYLIAGSVGEFWTEMHLAHRRSLARWNSQLMKARGIRFGQGLQLTNILRDLARDLRIGRCYLPREELDALGLKPEDLLDPAAIGRARPLIVDLIGLTLAHYREGWAYTLAIPRREPRMRLACAWPLLIGLRTLARVARASNLLDPGVTVKISRPAVHRLLATSILLVGSNRALTRYYRRSAAGVLPEEARGKGGIAAGDGSKLSADGGGRPEIPTFTRRQP